ncbi:hypothetical protein [Natronolimnobius baerhuensis]|uniref:Uncharacterized protein n=1 Tax=Natronolimnobius baerhuensis TaxID=253108 RepID=A0A202E6S0_9EURY|nr:hypothetical protein [Natronolimnobius baerhuensis]OVE83868.1 hypothetical protein B2G88_15765 [Natronolimnobius baerhuensis]
MTNQTNQQLGAITRRSCLGVIGGAVVGSATATATAKSDFETVTVAEDTREVVFVDDGETLENVTYDVTAAGAGVSIVAVETDWTIRNVAIHGTVEMGDNSVFSVGDTDGGTSRIENVWLGDGDDYQQKGATGFWTPPSHDGHLEIERVNVQSLSDNAFYCSPPGRAGGGTVAFRDCYAANCWVAQYRLAAGTIDNCVASVTDSRPYRQGRGVWAWNPGTVEVVDSEFDMNGHHYSFRAGANGEPSHMTITDTEWDDGFNGGWTEQSGSTIAFESGNGTNPQNQVPDGCPTSAGDVFA